MGITLYPAVYNPRTKTYPASEHHPSGLTILIEVDVLENFDEAWDNPDVEEFPFVSLNSQSVADLAPLLEWNPEEGLEGMVYRPFELCVLCWRAKAIIGKRNDEFQGAGQSTASELVKRLGEGGCKVVNLGTSTLCEKLDRIIALCEWVEERKGRDARIQIG